MFDDYETVTGSPDGPWQVDIQVAKGRIIKVRNASIDLADGKARIRAYDQYGARDCDGWLLRLFDMLIAAAKFEAVTDTYVMFTGFATGVGYFTAEEQPAVQVADNGDRFIESCFPPDRLGLPYACGVEVQVRAGRDPNA